MRDEGSAKGSPRPAPFLTDEQRAALDQALRDKAQEQAKARAAANHKAAAASGERKSRSVKGPGGAKKGGGGGKFTWGSIMTSSAADEAVDRGDPNYDSEEDERQNVVLLRNHQEALRQEVAAYKEAVRSLVEEYFLSGSVSDVAASLEELGGAPHLGHYFVKRLLTTALDRKDREREAASALLSNLYAEVIPPQQLLKGFTSLFASLPDLVLDVPDAPDLLSRFVLRAVVDDVLPPAVVTHIDPESCPAAKDLRQRCEAQLAARHSAEKGLRCWGGSGTGTSHADTKAAISSLLSEYLVSHDGSEAARRLRELGLPFFHHELVKQALMAATDNPNQVEAVVALLARLSSTGEVSCSQLAKGLRRVADSLADAVLDNPAAGQGLGTVVAAAKAAGVFDDLSAEDVGANAAAVLYGSSGEASATAASGAASPAVSSGGAAAVVVNGTVGGVVVAMPPGVGAFKATSVAALREYFNSQDAGEVGARLLALDEPGLHPLFVKAAVSLALDRRDRERELVSKLLVALVPEVISHEALSSGFTRLLSSADDLVLDVPEAVHLLALFTGRAVVDELLPPAFLTQVLPSLDAGGLGVAVVRSAGLLLGARHGTERLVNCWHGETREDGVEGVRAAVRAAVQEYGTSGDVAEVARCLRELDAPAYGHEAVVAAVELAFSRYHGHKASDTPQAAVAADATPAAPTSNGGGDGGEAAALAAACGPVVALLDSLASQGVLTSTQLVTGFGRVRAALEEEVLDYGPAARQLLSWLTEAGQRGGWLTDAE